MSNKSKEVAKKDNKDIAEVENYGQWGSAGFEDTTQDDLSIPFIKVLQSLSPEITDELVEGAKAGHIFNTITEQLSDELIVIPVHKDRKFIEWVPADSGGGFVGTHDPESDIVQQAIKDNGGSVYGDLTVLETGNELQETHQVYVLILDESGETVEGFAVIPFTSSKIKVVKKWFTALFMLKGKPPLFASRARLKTVKVKGDKGTYFNFSAQPLKETWKNSLISPSTPEGTALLEEGSEFRKSITSGEKAADYTKASKEGPAVPSDDQF